MTKKEEKIWEQVHKGLEKWSIKSKAHKWLKFGLGDDDWYDEEEVLSSLLGHVGYFKTVFTKKV